MTLLVGRRSETHTVEAVLDSVAVRPAALIIEGDPGIGKTTLWRDALARARERGMRVLAARASAAESVLAYATLADLLTGVDHATWSDLPTPQRRALAAALLEDSDGPVSSNDPRAVGAALFNVLTRLVTDAPVLLGIDDLQWLDASSAAAIGFATRRLPGRLIVVATVRTDAATAATGWVQSAHPDAVRRIRLPPLPIGEIHDVLTTQLGHPVARPRLVRIHEMSGGNPFYAVELAHELDRAPSDSQLALPESLAGLMRARIDRVQGDAADALLAIASLGDPTVHMVAAALERTPSELIALLGDAEAQGMLTIAGQRLRFSHPLLAHAVHTGATPARRRWIHRRLAEVVAEPELRARHLALADPAGEPETLDALDFAADIARGRGAPAAAAELLELAITRGGATPHRRIQLAQCLFDSGDPRRAREVLEAAIAASPPGADRAEARQRLAMVRLLDDSFPEAMGLLEQALAECDEGSKLQITALTMLAFTQLNTGHPGTALVTAEQAVAAAQRLSHDDALGRALSMRAMMRFFNGDGAEPAELQQAAALEGADERVPVALRTSVHTVLLRGWTGDYAAAREHLARIAADCAALGEEGEMLFLAYQIVLFDIWRGDLGRAAEIADDALRRARHLGGEAASIVASSLQAAVAAYQGRVEDARRHIDIALVAGAGSGYVLMTGYVVSLQGFVELSLGNHEQALAFLEPLLPMVHLAPRSTEILMAGFVPDAVEALINRGRTDEAESLVAVLEDNGARLDRPWMLAAGARCRAMLTVAGGDLDMAVAQAREALRHHDRLEMPFERGRTLLLLGRLERRLRRWRPAATTLSEAAQIFDRIGTSLWTAQVRTELQRGTPGRARTSGLTPSEQRVAELAADGMSNKEIATALFIAPKTVDTNLSRVYSKLGIHSRVELVHALRKGNTGAPSGGRPSAPDG